MWGGLLLSVIFSPETEAASAVRSLVFLLMLAAGLVAGVIGQNH
jgi:hypothetical protein